jgi:hypothetical protein
MGEWGFVTAELAVVATGKPTVPWTPAAELTSP